MTMKILSRIEHAELIHFHEDDLMVSSYAGVIKISYLNGDIYKISLPLPYLHKFFKRFRIFRRLLRIDKVNAVVINKAPLLLMIIHQGSVYRYDHDQGLGFICRVLNGSSLLHDSIAITPFGVYFGEYVNQKRSLAVNIYKIDIELKNGDIIYTFENAAIKHIHSCSWDPYDNKLWILTGDNKNECKIITADHDFMNISIIGQGDQIWRAVSIIFKQDYVYWFMDSPSEPSRLVRYSRSNGSIQLLQEFPGPIWYVKELSTNLYVLSTVIEPGDSTDDNFVYMYQSNDLENWKLIHTFKKDLLSSSYFKFSTIYFSSGNQSKSCFYISAQSIRNMDGSSYRCSLQ